MNLPPEIEQALLQILKIGILQARSSGWDGDALRCAAAADHIHNLPDILRQGSIEALRYYYEVERPAFVEQYTGASDVFEPYWEALAEFLEHQPAL